MTKVSACGLTCIHIALERTDSGERERKVEQSILERKEGCGKCTHILFYFFMEVSLMQKHAVTPLRNDSQCVCAGGG